MPLSKVLALVLGIVLTGCSASRNAATQRDNGNIEIIVLQLNDVYEIAPLPGDNLGGLARVATLKRRLISENPNTFMILAGDFVSPSVIGTLDDENGEGIDGKHMVETLNHAGLDIAIFGNHEFDIKEADLQKRINESAFDWVSSNVFYVQNGQVGPFYKVRGSERQFVPKTLIRQFSDGDGTELSVGVFAVTLDVKDAPHVTYEDPTAVARAMLTELQEQQVDLVLPITHLNIADDELLAEQIPHFRLIMGGHDHHHMAQKVGKTTITKADANAKTAYVHRILHKKRRGKTKIRSTLVTIDSTIPSDPGVQAVVDKWQQIADSDLKKKGFDPDALVTTLDTPLDGREQTVRGGQCELGAIITGAIYEAAQGQPDLALTNSGSIRVDDILTGKLTQYDIIRILPYSGETWEVTMTGTLLKRLLEASEANVNEGAYLQMKNVEIDAPSKTFRINGELVKVDRNYRVALNDFMLAGYDYKWLTEQTEGIVQIDKPSVTSPDDVRLDIRKAVIAYLSN